MDKQNCDKKYLCGGLLVIAVVMVCMLTMASKACIFFDEAFTLNLIRHPFSEMIRLTALDVHPPLYYIVVKVFSGLLGKNNIAIYAASVLSFLVLLLATLWFFKKYFSAKAGLLAVIALSAVPNMLKYAMQLRMYSLAVMLITVGFYLLYILTKRIICDRNYKWNRYWTALAVVHVLAAYTHYFAGVAAVASAVFLLAVLLVHVKEARWKMVRNWVGYCAVMLVLYLPWLPILFNQMSSVDKDYWIEPLTVGSVYGHFLFLFEAPLRALSILLAVVYLVGFFLLVKCYEKNHQKSWLMGCYVVAIIWFALGIGYSVVKSPILIDRYVIIIAPLLWLPICVGIAWNKNKILYVLTVIGMLCCFICTYHRLHEEYVACNQNELVSYIDSRKQEDDIFFHFYVQDTAIWSAYFSETEHYMYEGMDNAEVFRHWSDLTDCHLIETASEVGNIQGDIWCMNGDYLAAFTEEGWQIETISLNAGTIYRLYR